MKNLTWQNPEQLFVAQELINKVKSKCCGIKDTLNESTSNIIQLLTLFKKIELIANEDIDAIEYIRYIVYQALIDRK